MIPFSLARRPIAGMSWIVPTSLFANMTEMRIVLSVIAWRIVSTSTSPSGWTGTYVISYPCRSSRLHTSRPARCSIAVVTMWLPFSRYISTAPLSARLIDSVPPDVNTISFGSRAPMILASCPRAWSTAVSASQPNEWLRLAGWPNFCVKYGSIASTTRGSVGVVDCASMKTGNFIARTPPGSQARLAFRCGSHYRRIEHLGHVLARQLREAHAVEHVADRRLDLLHRASQVAPRDLRALVGLETIHDVDRPLEHADHVPDRDLGRASRQHVASLGPVLARDESLAGQLLEDLGEELGWNRELLRDTLGVDRAHVVVDGDVVDRHQPVVGSLGEPQHEMSGAPDSQYTRHFWSATISVGV